MATPGHPFDTRSRDRLRARHRRALHAIRRAIPAEFFAQVTSQVGDVDEVQGADRPVLEEELRRVADELLTPDVQQFLEAQSRADANLLLANFLDQHAAMRWRVVEHDPRTDEFVFEDIAYSAAELSRTRVGLVPTEHRLRLVQLILMLTYAERLADDDYSLPEATA